MSASTLHIPAEAGVTVHPDPPDTPPAWTPAPAGLWHEVAFVTQAARSLIRWPSLRRGPAGQGETVCLIPGWLAPQASMAPLRAALCAKGYRADHWGLGTNRGQREADAEQLAQRLSASVQQGRRSQHLLGWSLGGTVAREAARLAPHAVASVITLGTPALGGPTYTLGAHHWGTEECRRIADKLAHLDRTQPIPVPITAIYSRADAVVAWPACIDRHSPRVTHVEVRSTHAGLGIHAGVWAVVFAALRAQRDGHPQAST